MEKIIEKLHLELTELTEKKVKLSTFLDSDASKKISLNQEELLINKLNAMSLYAFILEQRILDLEK